MAELKNTQEPTFPLKRKPDDPKPLDTQDPPSKTPKLATLDDDENNNNTNEPNSKNHTDCSEPGNDGNELQNDVVHDTVVEEEKEEGGGDDEDEDDDEEESNGEAEVDPKGKGVLRDNKGKGKLIEEEEDDDDDDDDDDSDDSDDDSDEDGNVSGADSDFSDDPLAEVDLNNILPSRTRRRTVHPGLNIASDACNVAANDDGDSDA